MLIIKPVILTHPDGYRVVPKPGEFYAPDDPLVLRFPWAFSEDGQPHDQPIETATHGPGEKRTTKRTKQP